MIRRQPCELVLAVSPHTRGLAFACFEGPLAPVDWGIKPLRGRQKNARAVAHIRSLVEALQPAVLVTERYTVARRRRSPRLVRLQTMIESYAAAQAIDTEYYGRDDIRETFRPAGACTRYEIAEIIASQVNAFSFRLPPRRRLWMSDDPRMALFDAAALSYAHFHNRGRLAE